ncbi:hypothetical protein N0V88_006908 [Collariella sp. IMI 366227]|nr:hypothetical protein N0V88_006908 [Collariella sp. IMI 366227]
MAGFASDSDDSYGYDFTASDEELLCAAADRLSSVSPLFRPNRATLTTLATQTTQTTPATPAPRSRTQNANTFSPTTSAIWNTPFASQFSPDATLAIEDTIAAIDDDDLTFDISELDQDDSHDTPSRAQSAAYALTRLAHASQPTSNNVSRKLAASVSDNHAGLFSFAANTKATPSAALLPGPDVSYPDCKSHVGSCLLQVVYLTDQKLSVSRALPVTADVEETAASLADDNRSPLLRFRTYPQKPFSVTDLIAGAWCELQYFYTLTRLPGGQMTRTVAMKQGSKLHKKLEREVFTPVKVNITKKEDKIGLRIWNMIQGLRMLRDQGFTRELEVWGMVDGNVVVGIIDDLSYENPDPELQDDVLSSRGSSQTITNSQPYEPSTPNDHQIFITDVKTRMSPYPPSKVQARSTIIQLFLYHRLLSDMASGRLDYIRVVERLGINPDETFSDPFMAEIAAVHEEILGKPAPETFPDFASDNSSCTTDRDFVSAPSSPSQLALFIEPTLKYRSIRLLLSLLKSELALTFPRGAADLGNIVAVEYRYRGQDSRPRKHDSPSRKRDSPDGGQDPSHHEQDPPPREQDSPHHEQDPSHRPSKTADKLPSPVQVHNYTHGDVICTQTFFVEPRTLDLYLKETMEWWRGDRPPRGVTVREAAFKCRSCEFANSCDWRKEKEEMALRRAEGAVKGKAREAKREARMEKAARERDEVWGKVIKGREKLERKLGVKCGTLKGELDRAEVVLVTGLDGVERVRRMPEEKVKEQREEVVVIAKRKRGRRRKDTAKLVVEGQEVSEGEKALEW